MYILDTDISIFTIQGKHSLREKIVEAKYYNCFLSDITIAELLVGVENSLFKEDNLSSTDAFVKKFQPLDISPVIPSFAKEKVRLKSSGIIIADFDILIGVTAVFYDFTLVTNNEKHFSRIKDIKIENWTKSNPKYL
ncbi:MAG: PIN domain-containing protein [Chitinophagaceae bacterium]